MTGSQPSIRMQRLALSLKALLLVILAATVVRTAWLSDDAYITLRVVDNFVEGYGLRWNTFERVQAFTHPLWALVLSAAYYITREHLFTTLAVSMAVSMAAVWTAASGTPRNAAAAMGLVLMLMSRAFMDFSTGGLENPLSHLLLSVMALAFFSDALRGDRRIIALSFIASLGILNRMDTALVFLPPLLYELSLRRTWRSASMAAAGLAPFILWEIFSIIYYGFPFPNTAYAKLATGMGALEAARNGVYYLLDSLMNDPVTVPAIAAGAVLPLIQRNARMAPFSVGIILYVLYVIRIGGDAMSGRFLSVPFFLSVLLVMRMARGSGRVILAVSLAALLAGLALTPYPPLASGADYGLDRGALKAQETEFGTAFSYENPEAFISAYGIADERGYYYRNTGLLRALMEEHEMPDHPWAAMGRILRAEGRRVHTFGSVGFMGFFGGPGLRLIDVFALCDPLLARLPDGVLLRPGHFRRAVPEGYPETLLYDSNHITDPRTAALYDELSLITRGPLLSRERFRAIWRMNTGQLSRGR